MESLCAGHCVLLGQMQFDQARRAPGVLLSGAYFHEQLVASEPLLLQFLEPADIAPQAALAHGTFFVDALGTLCEHIGVFARPFQGDKCSSLSYTALFPCQIGLLVIHLTPFRT